MIYQQLNEAIDKTEKIDNSKYPLAPPSPTFADIPSYFPTWDTDDTEDIERTEYDDKTSLTPSEPLPPETDYERKMRMGQLVDQDLPSATADHFLLPGETTEQMSQRVLDRINQLQRDIKEGRYANKKILTRKLIQLSICENIYRSII